MSDSLILHVIPDLVRDGEFTFELSLRKDDHEPFMLYTKDFDISELKSVYWFLTSTLIQTLRVLDTGVSVFIGESAYYDNYYQSLPVEYKFNGVVVPHSNVLHYNRMERLEELIEAHSNDNT